ncbi:MAG: hypothetical protein JWO08_2359 [Verrucomicrobiaceae bacterium]|nr:hypothetical protein [Verrucomicrobiaceae bacterium]
MFTRRSNFAAAFLAAALAMASSNGHAAMKAVGNVGAALSDEPKRHRGKTSLRRTLKNQAQRRRAWRNNPALRAA